MAKTLKTLMLDYFREHPGNDAYDFAEFANIDLGDSVAMATKLLKSGKFIAGGQNMKKKGDKVLVVTLKCGRCGKAHDNLEFVKFKRPHDEFTHWASCPNTGEPILCGVTKPKKGKS
jgi:hypothetical protein